MKQIGITNGQLTVNKVIYNVVKVTYDQDTQSVVDANNQKITGGGVYMFVLNKDYLNFDINKFNREVTGIFFDYDGHPYSVVSNVPPYKYNSADLSKDYIFYVVIKKSSVKGRIKEHWTCARMTGTASLKLGFKSREGIKAHLDIYVILESDNPDMNISDVESKIREEYGAVFGE